MTRGDVDGRAALEDAPIVNRALVAETKKCGRIKTYLIIQRASFAFPILLVVLITQRHLKRMSSDATELGTCAADGGCLPANAPDEKQGGVTFGEGTRADDGSSDTMIVRCLSRSPCVW